MNMSGYYRYLGILFVCVFFFFLLYWAPLLCLWLHWASVCHYLFNLPFNTVESVRVHPEVLDDSMMTSIYIPQSSSLFWQENDVEKLHIYIHFIPVFSDAITVFFVILYCLFTTCLLWHCSWFWMTKRWGLDYNVLVEFHNRLLMLHVKCRGAYLLRLFDILDICTRISDVYFFFQGDAYISGVLRWKPRLPGSWANRGGKGQIGLFIALTPLFIAWQQSKEHSLSKVSW